MHVIDDSKALITANNLNDSQIWPESILNHLTKWCAVNGLALNIERSV